MDPTIKDPQKPTKKECSKAYADTRGQELVKDAVRAQLHQNYLTSVAQMTQDIKSKGRKIDPTADFCNTVKGHLNDLGNATNRVLSAMEIDAQCAGKLEDFSLIRRATESIVQQTKDNVKPITQACEFKFST